MKKRTNRERYWILLPPFLLAAVLTYLTLPEDYREYSFLIVLAFWISYHLWNRYASRHRRE
ncbi:hypothetical protein QRD89_06590 [Halobacillus sp. ACCC02827]|uniref:hypothetical protein n=1 Tax=Bacillaceae TaxID=186817 RepID=UPI0002F4DEAC|nr:MULTISPECIES: hypothetical protein [Bacillaceae]QHT46193.1 hypothetical protein M662_06705 [Bacillus sp. SB49]WJE17010.1 hypothetical protein QRD89_06590 [Halobacillus sp. ACCC02827]